MWCFRKPESWYWRTNNFKCLISRSAIFLRIRQHRNNLVELPDWARPAVNHQQRSWLRTCTLKTFCKLIILIPIFRPKFQTHVSLLWWRIITFDNSHGKQFTIYLQLGKPKPVQLLNTHLLCFEVQYSKLQIKFNEGMTNIPRHIYVQCNIVRWNI